MRRHGLSGGFRRSISGGYVDCRLPCGRWDGSVPAVPPACPEIHGFDLPFFLLLVGVTHPFPHHVTCNQSPVAGARDERLVQGWRHLPVPAGRTLRSD